MALSVTNFTAGDVITASAMNANFAAVENYVNSSPGMAALTGATFSGLITANGGITASGTTAVGTTNVSGLMTCNGGLTIQDGDTFTFDTEALTDCIDSGESFVRIDSALATAGAIVDTFLKYDVEGGADQGATLYIQAAEPYADGAGGGVKGDIWIDT